MAATRTILSQPGELVSSFSIINDNAPHNALQPSRLFSIRLFCSDFLKSTATSEQIQRQELQIRKLTADLKKEKDESKKKDAALRKYESFYREVKARSAQKAAQRRQNEQVQQRQRPNLLTSRVPR